MSVKRHTAYNLAGALLPLLAIFFTLPLYLAVIGEARYGVLAILWTLLGYFGLFDLGLGRAVTNRIAALVVSTPAERHRVFWTALSINLVFGVLAAATVLAAGDLLFSHFLDTASALSREVEDAMLWIALCVPALLASSVMSGALMGREEFLLQNAVRGVEGVLMQVFPLLAAVLIAPEVKWIVLAVLVVRVLATAALFVTCVVRLPVRLSPSFSLSDARALTVFGGWVTITSTIGPILSTLDRVILGAASGMRAVTYYAVPFGLVSRLSIIPGSLSTALFPRFSSIQDDTTRLELQNRAVRALTSVITPLVLLGLFAMAPFLAWWVDADFSANAAFAGEILLVGVWINCLAYLPFALLQGSGRPDLVAKIHAAEVVPYLLVLWVALQLWGVAGAAAAWTLRCAVDAVLLFSVARTGSVVLRALLTPLAAIALLFLLVAFVEWTEPMRWIAGVVLMLFGWTWSWLTAPVEVRGLLSRSPRATEDSESAEQMAASVDAGGNRD